MDIPIKLLRRWKRLKSYGDFKEIAEKSGFHQNEITRAFFHKKCNIKVFEAIAEFYKERDVQIKKIVKQNQIQ